MSSVTATGGVLLLGVGLRLLDVKAVAVGDMLPALVVAPVLTALVPPCADAPVLRRHGHHRDEIDHGRVNAAGARATIAFPAAP